MTNFEPLAATQPGLPNDAITVLGAMAAPARLRILRVLCEGEQTVSALLALQPISQPNLSQHLANLYRSGIVDRRRDGTYIYYRLAASEQGRLTRRICGLLA
ncbi:ArsR/SmtB family transcription factor [Pseudorhodoferax sp.]|uniref:ArsR/SmtB family transcription factor n=1 Tax=Pseudorhodoferax sp. TaxID=1993553 RepID=UPI002DD6A16B|nr:metalloregulator ArsR/SmtB family transcription factor [Pseudorhodoferax sp.]